MFISSFLVDIHTKVDISMRSFDMKSQVVFCMLNILSMRFLSACGVYKSKEVPLVILGGSWIIWSSLGFQDRYLSGSAAISRDPETQRRGPLTLMELSKCSTLTGFLPPL